MVVVNGEAHEVDASQPNYKALRDAVLHGRWDEVPKHLTVEQAIVDWTFGEFTVHDGVIAYQGEALPAILNQRILKMVAAGDDPHPLLRFWERLENNPSYRSRNQLFEFLLLNPGIPITDDGHILFYKGVQRNFRDCHSGKFDNSPGQKLSMKRNRVSDDPSLPCHFGFHVGSRAYAASFGTGQTIITKVDPADVVCVPYDCSQQKVRVHRYEVVGVDNGGLLSDTVQTPDVSIPPPVTTPTKDPETGEPPVDPTEPLVVSVTKHTDGSDLEPGETAPKACYDTSQAIKLPLTGTEWDYMNEYDSLELLDARIMPLRAYARFNCLIIGASKMPGGKEVLVPAIVKARGYTDPSDGAPAHITARS
jgi:hypothetical protein